MKGIIERLNRLNETIAGSIAAGRIDFDAISQELDSISSELESRNRFALEKERQATAKAAIMLGDYR